MMDANAILTICVIFVFVIIFYGPWQSLCTDYARQIMLEQRDTIFLLAANGKLNFKSNEYKTIRQGFQANIRFAHELTITRFIYMLFFIEKVEMDSEPEFFKAIKRIEDPELRSDIHKMVKKSLSALLVMMLAKSLLFWVAVLPMLVAAIVARVVSKSAWSALCAVTRKIGGIIQVESEKNSTLAT